MDMRSLQHILGLTAHDRTSKSIFHPHLKMKPPTVSTQFQVCLTFCVTLLTIIGLFHDVQLESYSMC